MLIKWPFALELLKQKITIVCTVRKNKLLLSVHASTEELRRLPIDSSNFYFHAKKKKKKKCSFVCR